MKTKRKSNRNNLSSFVSLSCWQLLSFIKFTQKGSDNSTKRHLRADGLSLLPSALRPRLVGKHCSRALIINEVNSLKHPSLLNNLSSLKPTFFSLVTVAVLSLVFSFFLQISYVSNASAASLTITIPSTPLSLDLNPSSNNGFASTSSSFNVKTDNSSGYTVSIKSKNNSGDNSLINTSSSTSSSNKLTSITEAISEDTFKNGSKYLNMWGWLPSKLNSLDNTNYQIAPGIEEVILESTEEANNETGTNYNISLAAKVSESMPTGSYSNTFVITSIANQPKIAGIMQEWDYNDCNALGEEEVVTLQDNRDGNTYKVAKLKDGKCWMVENLRIGGDEPIKMTSADSDVSSNFTLPVSSTNGFSSYDVANVYVPTTDSGNVKKEYGGYYTWSAATAGTGTISLGRGQEATNSICPKGWHLPKGNASGDFQALYDKYKSADLMLNGAPHFLLAGYYYNSSPNTQGSRGDYWSSTASGYSNEPDGPFNVYVLSLSSSSISPNDNWYTEVYYGRSVRCVQREKTMQDVSNWGKDLQVGDSIEAKDIRDNNKYSVSKLADGRIWMTSNLRIAGQTLNSETSDVGSDYELPSSDISGLKYGCDWEHEGTKNLYVDETYGGYYNHEVILANNKKSTYSICPKGWRPPTLDEFKNMVGKYNDNPSLLQLPPVNLELNGYVDGGLLIGNGTEGNYWTSTELRCSSHYVYHITASGIMQEYNNHMGVSGMDGVSLRCIARELNENYDGSDRFYSGSNVGCEQCM